MNVLELIWNLEEAYHRFGDIPVKMETEFNTISHINSVIIESEDVTIKANDFDNNI